MLETKKAVCLVEIGSGTAQIIRSLFLLLNGGITDEQQDAINESIQDFADVEKKLVHNLRKAFENGLG